MLKRLRLKFICINMLIVIAMLTVIFSLVLHFTRANLESESLGMMQTAALRPMQPGMETAPGGIPDPYFILQISPRGDLHISGSGYFDLTDEEFLMELMEEVLSAGEQAGVIDQYQLRFFRSGGPTSQTIVFSDISSEIRTLQDLRRTCALIGAVSFLAFFLISFLLAKWAVKPVDQAWRQQKQFVADASHELKTPLTVIMTNAELLLDPATADRAQCAGSILTMSRQMRSLVESLLELARADSGAIAASFAPVDLSQLAGDALLPFEPVYFEAGLSLVWAVEPGVFVNGSEAHLRQVIDILLDNARKYAYPQAEVCLTLKRQGRHCLLSVANPGEAISREDLKNIFKRFYRLDKARSRTGSYGLGLSIAEGIAHAHQGKIWAESSNGVNTFFVQLPLA